MYNNFNSLDVIGILVGALLATLILALAWPIGERLKVIDYPDNGRKNHARATPLVGGIAIMVPLLLWSASTYLWPDLAGGTRVPLAVLVCGGGAALAGYFDDRSSVPATARLLIFMALTVIALKISPQLLPTRFHWGHLVSTPVTPWLAYVLVAIGMAGYVNAVNMADGQDGCSVGMFAIWATCIVWTGSGFAEHLALIMLATSLAVLAFNLRGKVFLGGTGAYGVTFVFGLQILYLHNSWGVTGETIIVWFFVPIVDCLRLLIQRPMQGRSPFEGDRNHMHHRLHDRFGKNAGLAIYLGLVASTSFAVAYNSDFTPVCLALVTCAYLALMLLTAAPAAQAATAKIVRRD